MKQELLKWIYENKVGLGTVETVYMDDLIEMINELEEPQVTNEQAWNKIAETYPETAQNLRITLDHAVYGHEAEPQKVKVPSFIGRWIEEVKQRGCGLADALNCFASPIMAEDVKEWLDFNFSAIGCHHDHQELLARAWLDGYEVDEERKWVVKVGNLYFCGWEDTTAQFVMNTVLGEDESIIKYKNEGTASSVAKNLGGTAEKV